MIVRKPSLAVTNISNWNDFYKFSISDKQEFNYSLTPKELARFEYNQYFLKNLKGVVLYPSVANDDASVNLAMKTIYNPNLVYCNPGRGGAFGDSLGWMSFVCRLSEISGKPIKLSRLPSTCENIRKSILDTTGTYEIVKSNNIFFLPGATKGGYREVYSRLFMPAKKLWQANKNKLVAVQFGKRGQMDRRLQDPKDEERIIKALESKGYTIKQLGGTLGDIGCMELAAECEFFVGTCSGMSHLCHSVGTPVHMLTNNRSLERVSAGHVKNSRSIYPTIFWQHPNHFLEYIGTL